MTPELEAAILGAVARTRVEAQIPANVVAAIEETHVLIERRLMDEIIEAASWRSADAHDLLLRAVRNQSSDLDADAPETR